MHIYSGKFTNYRQHHEGWFRIFRFKSGVEVWFGKKYYSFFKDKS